MWACVLFCNCKPACLWKNDFKINKLYSTYLNLWRHQNVLVIFNNSRCSCFSENGHAALLHFYCAASTVFWLSTKFYFLLDGGERCGWLQWPDLSYFKSVTFIQTTVMQQNMLSVTPIGRTTAEVQLGVLCIVDWAAKWWCTWRSAIMRWRGHATTPSVFCI